MRPPRAPRAELERAAEQVARDYDAFLLAGPGPGGHEDAKAFAAHHAACRAALAHLEALHKLVRAASDAGDAELSGNAALLEAARAGIAATEEPEDADED